MEDQTKHAFEILAEVDAAIKASNLGALRQTLDTVKACMISVLANQAFEAVSTLERTQDHNHLADAQKACRRLRQALLSLNPDATKPCGQAETRK